LIKAAAARVPVPDAIDPTAKIPAAILKPVQQLSPHNLLLRICPAVAEARARRLGNLRHCKLYKKTPLSS
jgi:hypothetical protein